MPGREDMPSTLRRSPDEAQDTWVKAHDSAVDEYGEGERAHRTAFSALKHKFEKVGDRWLRKAGGRKGPSDKQAAKDTPRSRTRPSKTAEGVDANASKKHLYEVAKRLGIEGRSKMTKDELVKAIEKANRRATAKARE
ncbi:ChaB family protein [Actinomadura rubrisoli]|uniref:Cation transport regulator ChaB n=1 Tax=Actinomadura rubrisoli TaxID=2530368 RepID=A0A4R5BLQ7_9ACTN|nr:ChaB family protein [Actinomadura rubrisoli]TDD87708.1 cation transport regulator ChaB [Actinomadura rubrisoli]